MKSVGRVVFIGGLLAIGSSAAVVYYLWVSLEPVDWFGLGMGAFFGLVMLIMGLVFSNIGGEMEADAKLLSNGRPAMAMIKSIVDTGTTISYGAIENPVYVFTLEVNFEGEAPYVTEKKQIVPRAALGMATPGRWIPVMVDYTDIHNLAIDWSGRSEAARIGGHDSRADAQKAGSNANSRSFFPSKGTHSTSVFDKISKLSELSRLKESGAITKEEYERLKSEIL